jgi:hypothetical protein
MSSRKNQLKTNALSESQLNSLEEAIQFIISDLTSDSPSPEIILVMEDEEFGYDFPSNQPPEPLQSFDTWFIESVKNGYDLGNDEIINYTVDYVIDLIDRQVIRIGS